MRCVRETDTTAFDAKVQPWLAVDPFANNVVSTVVSSHRAPSQPPQPGPLWVTVEDPAIVGVAVMTPPRGLLLSAMPDEAARALATWIADQPVRPPSVDGPVGAAAAFRTAYTDRLGLAASPGRSSRRYRLDQVVPPVGVPGAPRPAAAADRDLLVDWSGRFAKEIGGPVGEDRSAPVDGRLRTADAALLWLWEVDGEPTSMAWLNAPVAGVSRINGVYTPPPARGHGYASACVAAASQHALDSGSRACMLYTDLANPTTNRIYQAIGYRPVGDSQAWTFAPQAPGAQAQAVRAASGQANPDGRGNPGDRGDGHV